MILEVYSNFNDCMIAWFNDSGIFSYNMRALLVKPYSWHKSNQTFDDGVLPSGSKNNSPTVHNRMLWLITVSQTTEASNIPHTQSSHSDTVIVIALADVFRWAFFMWSTLLLQSASAMQDAWQWIGQTAVGFHMSPWLELPNKKLVTELAITLP